MKWIKFFTKKGGGPIRTQKVGVGVVILANTMLPVVY